MRFTGTRDDRDLLIGEWSSKTYYSYADQNEKNSFRRSLFLLPTGVKAGVECTGIAEAFASLHRSCRANRGSACKGVVQICIQIHRNAFK
eukprot:scaffold26931_cov52-Cyclotella_meneghiniana.AAC.3